MLKPYQLHWLHRLQFFLINTHLISTRGFRKRLSKYLMGQARDGMVVRTLYGFSLHVDPCSDNGLDRGIYLRGTYEPGTLAVIQECLRPGEVFVDAGANIGLMSLLAARTVGPGGSVYSFEADPANFSILERNLALNRAANVRPFNLALGSSPGQGLIYRSAEGKGSSSLFPPGDRAAAAGVPIRIQTLDAFLAGRGPLRIRMLKADVEGWELEFLKGAAGCLAGPEAPILCLEYSHLHLAERPDADFYPFLREVNQYRIFKLAEGKFKLSRLTEVMSAADLPDEDNLFCFLPAHLETLPRRLFAC